ncbi:MAG: nitroreductase family protein [Clostridiaceae bacterium]|nr:nitroreductase family protein [Clostridiaceae bacterium]
MDFYKLCRARYSVRKFAETPVEEAQLLRILETGASAPTAKNLQPQRIYVLKSREAMDMLRGITRCAFNAPMALLVCADVREAWVNPFNGRSSAEMDASIVASQMMLQAAELGLGSTWCCWVDFAKIKEAFQLPEEVEPYCLLPLGYPAHDCIPSGQHTVRKPLAETVTEI